MKTRPTYLLAYIAGLFAITWMLMLNLSGHSVLDDGLDMRPAWIVWLTVLVTFVNAALYIYSRRDK
jgi:hypothetical protein